MTEKQLKSKLLSLLKVSYKKGAEFQIYDNEISLSCNQYEFSILNFDISQSYTNCATTVLHDFEFHSSLFKDSTIAFVELITYCIGKLEGKAFILSDSKRNDEIYKYIPALQKLGWKVFAHRTSDSRSVIRLAIYIPKPSKDEELD